MIILNVYSCYMQVKRVIYNFYENSSYMKLINYIVSYKYSIYVKVMDI